MTQPMTETDRTEGSIDKLYDHHRQQLSAMLDGALSPDAARFMLRRLQHDTELAACWERWQVCGDVLRGQRNALLPANFAQRIAKAITVDQGATVPAVTAKPRWTRWGGAALAASVAMVALFVARQIPSSVNDPASTQSTASIVAASSGAAAQTPVPTAPSAPETASQLAAAAVAVAQVPRRAAARRSRGQSQRAASRVSARNAEAPVALIAVNGPSLASPVATSPDPFATQALTAPIRPWPRAILPNFPAAGALTVEYGSSGGSTFYPFEPRVPREASAGASASSRSADPGPQP
ncbi:MAG: RseA family anti-sigma factor [Luteimonas sp.]